MNPNYQAHLQQRRALPPPLLTSEQTLSQTTSWNSTRTNHQVQFEASGRPPTQEPFIRNFFTLSPTGKRIFCPEDSLDALDNIPDGYNLAHPACWNSACALIAPTTFLNQKLPSKCIFKDSSTTTFSTYLHRLYKPHSRPAVSHASSSTPSFDTALPPLTPLPLPFLFVFVSISPSFSFFSPLPSLSLDHTFIEPTSTTSIISTPQRPS
ncbi:hypothetical protein H4Q26_006601 [Puccinia striiformis f. sp. tritici PST-130]|nr:hypothetical protein H4Q26_006601 [Puccinia striiformis f. sp. tritici PST-130]